MSPRTRSILLGGTALALVVVVVGWLLVRGRKAPPPRRLVATIDVGPGSPLEAERSVAVVAERASTGLAGVDHVESRSTTSRVTLTLTLAPSADPTAVGLAWSAALVGAGAELPPSASSPQVHPTGTHAVHLFVRSDKRQDELVARTIRPALLAVPGVREVETCDVREPEVRVTLDPARLTALGVDAVAVADAIESASPSPASAADLGKLRVGNAASTLHVEDVAVVASTEAPLACRAFGPAGELSLLTVDLDDEAATTALDAAIAKLALPPKTSVDALDPPGTTTIFAEVATGDTKPEELQATALLLAKLVGASTEVADVAIVQDAQGLDVDLVLRVALKPGVNKASGREALARTLASMPGTLVVTADTDPPPALWVIGPDLGRLETLSDDVAKAIRGTSGVRGALQIGRSEAPAIAFDVDRAAAARLSIDPARAASLIRLATAGLSVGSVGGVPTRVVLGERLEVAETRALVLQTEHGAIPLVEIATMKSQSEPRAVLRIDLQRGIRIDVDAQPNVRREALMTAARAVALPPGYYVTAP